jgi:hypothetical protein
MSFPYALLQFEAEQAKQRLTQMFHAAAGLCGENLSPPLKQRHCGHPPEEEPVD